MNVSLLALWSDSLTYTIARALASGGHLVTVWIVDIRKDRESSWSLSAKIAAIPGASVLPADETGALPEIDLLLIQGHPGLLQRRGVLDRFANRAARLTLVSAGDRSREFARALRIQWREWVWCGRWFRKVTRIAYKDGYHRLDWFGLLRSRRVVGFDAHSHFLQDDALYQAIHARDWDADAIRPIRANFVGSRDPEARARILDSVETRFARAANGSPQASPKQMFWHAFSDERPAALAPERFLEILSQSDFTLAPLGYSRITHRPIEALLRGSIPVLNADELDIYDMGLSDGVNCIAAEPGDWSAAVDRIAGMSEEQVVDMRHNVLSMISDQVAYPALARHIGRRLGLDA